MEIIVKGTPPSERCYEVSCSVCKTVFRFKQSEAHYVNDSRDGDYLDVKCPVCNKRMAVDVDLYKRQ